MECIAAALHDLCQPLTALQCSLDLGQMQDDTQSMRASMEGALQECARLRVAVARMRTMVRQGLGSRG
jgi:signal transduction histidine kinase